MHKAETDRGDRPRAQDKLTFRRACVGVALTALAASGFSAFVTFLAFSYDNHAWVAFVPLCAALALSTIPFVYLPLSLGAMPHEEWSKLQRKVGIAYRIIWGVAIAACLGLSAYFCWLGGRLGHG